MKLVHQKTHYKLLSGPLDTGIPSDPLEVVKPEEPCEAWEACETSKSEDPSEASETGKPKDPWKGSKTEPSSAWLGLGKVSVVGMSQMDVLCDTYCDPDLIL